MASTRSNQQQERRYLPRATLLAPAMVVDPQGWSQHALVEDLSPTGMSLVSSIVFSVDQHVQVVLQLPGLAPQYLVGQIKHVSHVDQKRFRYGISLESSLSFHEPAAAFQGNAKAKSSQPTPSTLEPRESVLLIAGEASSISRVVMETAAAAGLAAVAVSNSLDAIEWLLVKEAKIKAVCLEPLLPEEEQYDMLAFLGSEYPTIKRLMLHSDYQLSGKIDRFVEGRISADWPQEQLMLMLQTVV